MLTWEADVDAHALRRAGWTISAIARHLGHDRKTIRAYLSGQRTPGVRAPSRVEVLAPYAQYCRTRLRDDPHVWAATLYDEVRELGFTGSYPALTAYIRRHGLRPHCEPCAASRTRERAIITHPPGEELQFDWLELPDPPASWPGGAHLLVGALSHSGKWRAVLAEKEDFEHLVAALDQVLRRLGGTPRRWRTDRMSTVCDPGSGRLRAPFAQVAKHYGVGVDICPPRHGNRKGVVEKANHSAAQRWWRTLAEDTSPEQAQVGIDALAARMDKRPRRREAVATTVGELAAAEPLLALPEQAFPLATTVERTVSAQCLVAFRGNSYSVPPGLMGQVVQVRARLGAATVEIATDTGTVLARHPRPGDGAGIVTRADAHVTALEHRVLAAFNDAPPCRHKTRRPLSAEALDLACALRGATHPADAGTHVVIDMAPYAAAAEAARHTTPSPESPGEPERATAADDQPA